MARTRQQRAHDPLRVKLDQLAELAIDRILAKGEDVTLREITETLKTVAAYRNSSGASAAPEPKTAWNRYQQAMNGEDTGDGARH